MKLVKREPDEGRGMNMTPMIDVVFQLLIFFMLVSEIARTEKADLVLPKASEAQPDHGDPGRHTINVTRDGRIMVGGRFKTLEQIDAILAVEVQIMKKRGEKFSEKPILIRADKEAHFETVQKIMGKCVKHKIWRLSFGAMAGIEEAGLSPKGGGT